MADVQVKAEGLAQFRRDVRRADKEIGKEFQKDLRAIAQDVAREASSLAPRRHGALAGSYRGSARGATAYVRSPLIYARFLEFGFHPRGGDTFVEGRNFVGRAMERREGEIVDQLGEAVERAATNLGWH